MHSSYKNCCTALDLIGGISRAGRVNKLMIFLCFGLIERVVSQTTFLGFNQYPAAFSQCAPLPTHPHAYHQFTLPGHLCHAVVYPPAPLKPSSIGFVLVTSPKHEFRFQKPNTLLEYCTRFKEECKDLAQSLWDERMAYKINTPLRYGQLKTKRKEPLIVYYQGFATISEKNLSGKGFAIVPKENPALDPASPSSRYKLFTLKNNPYVYALDSQIAQINVGTAMRTFSQLKKLGNTLAHIPYTQRLISGSSFLSQWMRSSSMNSSPQHLARLPKDIHDYIKNYLCENQKKNSGSSRTQIILNKHSFSNTYPFETSININPNIDTLYGQRNLKLTGYELREESSIEKIYLGLHKNKPTQSIQNSSYEFSREISERFEFLKLFIEILSDYEEEIIKDYSKDDFYFLMDLIQTNIDIFEKYLSIPLDQRNGSVVSLAIFIPANPILNQLLEKCAEISYRQLNHELCLALSELKEKDQLLFKATNLISENDLMTLFDHVLQKGIQSLTEGTKENFKKFLKNGSINPDAYEFTYKMIEETIQQSKQMKTIENEIEIKNMILTLETFLKFLKRTPSQTHSTYYTLLKYKLFVLDFIDGFSELIEDPKQPEEIKLFLKKSFQFILYTLDHKINDFPDNQIRFNIAHWYTRIFHKLYEDFKNLDESFFDKTFPFFEQWILQNPEALKALSSWKQELNQRHVGQLYTYNEIKELTPISNLFYKDRLLGNTFAKNEELYRFFNLTSVIREKPISAN